MMLRFMMGSVTYSLAPLKDVKALQLALAMLLIGRLIHVGDDYSWMRKVHYGAGLLRSVKEIKRTLA